LTLEGERRLEEVLEKIFAFVALVREAGPQIEVFDELRLLSEVGFRFREESPAPENLAASATSSMHYYPPNDLLRGPSALDEWLPDVVHDWLESLTPEKCMVIRVTPELETQLPPTPGEKLPDSDAVGVAESSWLRERWYGAFFRKRALSKEELARWADPTQESRAGLAFPENNPFVPSDFNLRCDVAGAKKETPPTTSLEVTPPVELHTSALLKLWSKTDSTFRVPKVSINAHIMTPVYKMGPAAVVAMRLFCSLLNDDLNTYSYSAFSAGLSYNVDFSDRLTFGVGGFSHKLPKLLTKVAQRLRSLLAELTAACSGDADTAMCAYWSERLEKQRELLLRGYDNFYREDPVQIVEYNMRQVLLLNMWHISEYSQVLRDTDGSAFLKPLTEHVAAALARIRVEVLAHGNIADEEALDLAKTLKENLVACTAADAEKECALPDEEVPQNTVVILPEGPEKVFAVDFDLEAVNPVEENNAILNVYQIGPAHEDLKRDACLLMVAQLADPSAFVQLRTNEQLGYTVHAGYHRMYDVDGISVVIQGPRLPPAAMDMRIEAWLAQFREELEKMTDEVFETNVRSVVELKSERYKQLGQETGRHWGEIASRTYRFGRVRDEVDALKATTKAEVIAFFDRHIAATAPLRRKLSSRAYGSASRSEEQRRQQDEDVAKQNLEMLTTLESVRAFKEVLPTHSVG